jgi:hypothetical protein
MDAWKPVIVSTPDKDAAFKVAFDECGEERRLTADGGAVNFTPYRFEA